MELANPIDNFSSSIEKFVSQFSNAFQAIATPTDVEAMTLWFNYCPPSNLM